MTTTRFVRRLASDPHLWIIYVLAISFLAWHLLHALGWISQEVPHEGLLILTTVGILTLTGDRLWESGETKEQAQENSKRLSMISQAFLDARVALRGRPSESEEYAYLWGGYTGCYRVYNPSYRVDENVTEDEIVKLFVHRYGNPNFHQARYIFLTEDAAGQEDLSHFCRLMKLVKHKCPNVAKKVLVKEIKNKKSASTCEMYLGTRYGSNRAVMELREPGSEHGMPHFYLVIDDENIFKHYLKDHFEPAWNDKSAIDKDVFADS